MLSIRRWGQCGLRFWFLYCKTAKIGLLVFWFELRDFLFEFRGDFSILGSDSSHEGLDSNHDFYDLNYDCYDSNKGWSQGLVFPFGCLILIKELSDSNHEGIMCLKPPFSCSRL